MTGSKKAKDYGNVPFNSYGHPDGTGFRPNFRALWHLQVLNVIDNIEDFTGGVWEDVARRAEMDSPTRIVIIDTPVDYRHPSLKGAIDEGAMYDFSRNLDGVFVVPEPEPRSADSASREALKIAASNSSLSIAVSVAEEIEFLIDSTKGIPRSTQPINIIKKFGAHGTAVAGLIGGRPTDVNFLKLDPFKGETLKGENKPSKTQELSLKLPYAGINPFCRIIPVSISASPTPKMLLRAVQYTRLLAPDIVVVADSWDRPRGWKTKAKYGIWRKLDRRFRSLCREATVFCAAGNEALDKVVYPANLCVTPGGPWAVGACDEGGADLSYSPDITKLHPILGKAIKTLSSEVPRFDRDMTRIDPWHIIDKDLGRPNPYGEYPPRDIVTTDCPGRSGYNPSPYEYDPVTRDRNGPHYELASLFTRFAGTSASAAIAAGLASLFPGSELDAARRARLAADDAYYEDHSDDIVDAEVPADPISKKLLNCQLAAMVLAGRTPS